jgi:[protein-PII] uridylyltransferase
MLASATDLENSAPAASRLRHDREQLLANCSQQQTIPADFPQTLSALMDTYFRQRLLETQASGEGCALVAVGGYGRGELCPYSDIDLLLLFPDEVPQQAQALCRELFFPLWDLGLDLGHGVRGLEECMALAREDHQVFTSLVSARLLCGDDLLFQRLVRALQALDHDAGPAIRARLAPDLTAADHTDLGPNRLEPDLKNGPGGLRDYHRMTWLSRPAWDQHGQAVTAGLGPPFNAEDAQALLTDVCFVLQARSALHLAAGRKMDLLHLELQPQVAQFVGFSNANPGLAVEAFLSRLHQAMTRIQAMHDTAWRMFDHPPTQSFAQPPALPLVLETDGLGLCPGPLSPRGADMLALFKAMAETGLPLSWRTRRLVQSSLENARAELGTDPATIEQILALCSAPGVRTATRAMLETGFLAALIPEFQAVQDHVQFDAYHLLPVGAHTLETIARISDWGRQSDTLGAQILRRVKDPASLLLAALLHDIGKGGLDHAHQGAVLADSILARFGLPPEIREQVVFLIRHHLLLMTIATRQDLHDESTVEACANVVGDCHLLDQLFLLNMADAQATGPKAWNAWTSALLHELYFKTSKVLTHGPLSEPRAVDRIRQIQEQIRLQAAAQTEPARLEQRIQAMPVRYVLTMSVPEISIHLGLIAGLEQEVEEEKIRIPGGRGGRGVVALEGVNQPDKGCFSVHFAALDQPGLFPALCGVLTLHGLNVLAADVFTWADHTVITVFRLQTPPDLLYVDELLFRLKRSMKWAMTGKLFLDLRLEEKHRAMLQRRLPGHGLPPTVSVDNEASDFYTAVQIVADDHPGCLYRIARVFEQMHMHVQRAKIATQVDRIADSFDLRDHGGRKIEDPGQIRELEQALIFALKPGA